MDERIHQFHNDQQKPGTSPLYAYQAVFTAPPPRAEVLSAASLFFWTLTLVVLVKYVGVILRFDDNGEGEPVTRRVVVVDGGSVRVCVGLEHKGAREGRERSAGAGGEER